MTNAERQEIVDAIKSEIKADLPNGAVGVITRAATWLGMFVSLATLGTVLWRGGELAAIVTRTVADVATVQAKVSALEVTATSGAREYMARDDARSIAIEARVTRLEEAISVLPQIREDVAVIRTILLKHEDIK